MLFEAFSVLSELHLTSAETSIEVHEKPKWGECFQTGFSYAFIGFRPDVN